MTIEYEIRRKYEALSPLMNERMRRCWAGIEAEALGRGGVAIVERATGLSRGTIRAGREEIRTGVQHIEVVQVRRAGGGRPRLEERHPDLVAELEALVEPVACGDAESPLRWTSKSVRRLAAELAARGKPLSPQKVGQLLASLGYRLTAMQKAPAGTDVPDRDQQFRLINDRAEAYQARNAPVISVDMKQTARAAAPRSVSVDDETPELAVASISHWWSRMGRKLYEKATELLVTADAGCSHGRRSRLFKAELQKLARRTGLTIAVSLFPPGTSRWIRAEHRMACHITEHWHGQQAVDHEIVVQLIGATRTASAPSAPRLGAGGFHGDWNYTIEPR